MDKFFAEFAQNSVINIYSTLTTFSTCDSFVYTDDCIFQNAVFQPLVVKLRDSTTTFAKFNFMN
jgi:hypothetical protein